jgi:PEGA domain/Protein kinase domain
VKVFRLDVPPEQARALAEALSVATQAGLFHPSIVEPLAADVQDTVAFRAEEYVAAESLDVAVRHYAPSPIDKALPFITQLAGAIDFARAANVGHGALHLRDIFVTPDEARAGGFGVVDALERIGLRAPVRRPYSAPERIAGGKWGTPADVFSLAAVSYELLTGRRPSGTGDEIGALSEGQAGPRAAAVRAVLARAMDDDPARRFPAALALAAELETAARGGPAADVVLVPFPSASAIADFEDVGEAPTAPAVAAAVEIRPPDAGPEPDDELVEPEDVVLERDDDLAYAELHPVAAEPSERLLFDAEPEPADLPLAAADEETSLAPAAVAPGLGRDRLPPPVEREVFAGYAPAAVAFDHDIEDDHGRRSRVFLPMAIVLVIGLALGFAAGRLSLGPETPSTPSSAPAASPPPTPAPTVASGAREGKAFSEQAVASSGKPPAPVPDAPNRRPPAAAPAGRLLIRSTPSRASVTINSQWKGRTPLTVDRLAPGGYQVRVVQPGFVTGREDVTLSADEPTRTLTFQLQPVPAPAPAAAARGSRGTQGAAGSTELTGSLTIDSRPRGAKVFVDGRLVGTTPAQLPQIAIGSHVVRLELAEHRVWSTTTQVVAGREARVAGSLERMQ